MTTLIVLPAENEPQDAWDAFIGRLSGRRTLIFKPAADGALTLEAFADEAIAFAEAEKVAPAVWVGARLGGAIAQRVAAERPDLVSALVLVASPSAPGEPYREHHRFAANGTTGEARRVHDALAEHPEGAWPEGALRAYKGPALVVEPTLDPLYSPVQTMMWRANLPQSEVVRVDERADFYRHEAGAAWLASRIDELTSRYSPRSGTPHRPRS